jgi:hypothetical protein
MKKIYFLFLILIGVMNDHLYAQKIYAVTSGEMIFSQNQSSFTPEFLAQYPGAKMNASNVRYTVFFHFGQYIHYDLNNSIGFYSGLGIRNVGMITDETLPQTVTLNGSNVPYVNYNIIRRQYMLGIPLALKLGSFNNHFYLFGGGEIEMAFQFKEKFWTGSFDRSGPKTKDTEWFSSHTPTFMPSVFAGVQLPGGVNIRFKYYLNDFLNSGYKVSSNELEGSTFNVTDLSRYKESKVFYVSLCWQFNTSELVDRNK